VSAASGMGEGETRLSGLPLLMTRGLWLALAAVATGLLIPGIPARYEQLLRYAADYERPLLQIDLSVDFFAAYFTAIGMAVVGVHLIIAAIVFARRSEDWVAWIVSLALVARGSTAPLSVADALLLQEPVYRLWIDLLAYAGMVAGVAILFVFPDGRYRPRWTRWLTYSWALLVFPAIFLPESGLSLRTWPVGLQALLLIGLGAVGVVVQVYRYRRVSSPAQRQQTKWALLGLFAAALGPFGYFLPFIILPSLSQPNLPNLLYQLVGPTFFIYTLLFQIGVFTFFALVLLLFPVSFAVAVLRYRLWDIDLIINRTLVYGGLTAALALLYLVGVVALEAVFRALTGQTTDLAIVATTLSMVALASPLRRFLQGAIDRRFYRQKYDAAQTLAAFAATLRDEVDLQDLTESLLAVVDEAMRPTHLGLWLSAGKQRQGTSPRVREHTKG
jgi:hypothetical protein